MCLLIEQIQTSVIYDGANQYLTFANENSVKKHRKIIGVFAKV